MYDPHSDEEGCFGWAGERIERLSEIHVKDDKGGEEAGETGKPEPVGGIEDDQKISESNEDSEIGPPVWLKWVLAVTSHLLLLAIGVVVTWMFFPRQIIFFVDLYNKTITQGPPGSHIDPDGRLSVPSLRDGGTLPEKNSKPAPQEIAPQPTKPDSGKDQDVPRK